MYASIRRYKTTPGRVDELVQRVNQGFVPLVSRAPGFVGYFVLDAGSDVVASVSIFQDEAGAEESNRLAADWVRANIASLFEGPPEITAGEVRVHQTA
jgi:heme-degrading monooxygenase HmoA